MPSGIDTSESVGQYEIWCARQLIFYLLTSPSKNKGRDCGGREMNNIRKEELVLLVFGFLKDERESFPQSFEAFEREAEDVVKPCRPTMKSLQCILVSFQCLQNTLYRPNASTNTKDRQ
jgi:hypothetical protein